MRFPRKKMWHWNQRKWLSFICLKLQLPVWGILVPNVCPRWRPRYEPKARMMWRSYATTWHSKISWMIRYLVKWGIWDEKCLLKLVAKGIEIPKIDMGDAILIWIRYIWGEYTNSMVELFEWRFLYDRNDYRKKRLWNCKGVMNSTRTIMFCKL